MVQSFQLEAGLVAGKTEEMPPVMKELVQIVVSNLVDQSVGETLVEAQRVAEQ
jgi:hypothetical protein